MIDEGRLSEELGRAARAERLLADDMLQDAFSAVKAKYEKDWLGSKLDDVTKRERCFLAMKALDDVLKAIEQHVTTGKFAKASAKKQT